MWKREWEMINMRWDMVKYNGEKENITRIIQPTINEKHIKKRKLKNWKIPKRLEIKY